MFCKIPALFALAALPPILPAASSLPSGGGFTTGSGAIVAAGNTLTINQSTFRGIINWNNFSIGQGGLVTFNNGAGVTLNRVTGPAPSTILGRLIASGSVYLLNPEGILVGHGATVHTGGDFLASTLTLSGTTLLSGPSLASVVNLGNISSGGGNIYLIAHSVQNAGSLTAPNGTVGLAAGNQVLIGDDSTHGRIIIQGPGGDVVDSGFIAAAQAELKSNGGNIYALAGNNGGQIQATGTATQNGHIWLIAEHGTTHVSDRLYAVDANGGGGAIETSGAQVVTNGAQIKTGKGGSWLLDPNDITIDSTLASTIETTLNGGTNVTEQTTSSGTGGVGDINVVSPISWSGNSTLILDAYHSVTVNGAITASGSSGGLNITTNDGGSGGYFTANSPVTLASTGYLTINAANYTLITSTSALHNISTTGNFAVDANLNFNAFGTWSPISFTGNLQGLGHTLSNLYITHSGNYTGLIGTLTSNASVANLNVSGASEGTVSYAGILAGSAGGLVYNTHVSGSVTGGSAGNYAGGLIGYDTGSIVASSSSASVNGHWYVGGLVGDLGGSGAGITASYATGNINIGTTVSPYDVGGLVGASSRPITSSYATGNITVGTAHYAGGLVGNTSAAIISSYATGTVSAGANSSYLGGLVGFSTGQITSSYATGGVSAGSTSSAIGGLAGYNGSSIATSYATGAVSAGSGSSSVRGFVGQDAGSSGSGNYWDITTSGQTTDGGNATGLTTAQWLTQGPAATSASGWDFTNTWLAGYPYPVLRALPYVVTTFNSASRTYGSASPSYTIASTLTQTGANASSLVSGTLTALDGTSAASNVGTYNIGGSGQSATGYQMTYLGTLGITAATLTYTATPVSSTYGAAVPSFTGSVTGFVNNDTLSSATTGSASFTSSATSSSNAGSYAINGSGLTATNYTFTQAAGNSTAFTINPALLTYTATPVSSTYGAAVPSFTGSVTGFVNNDTLSSATTGSVSFTSSATSSSNVGSYAINGSGLTATNYTFAQDPGNATAFTINPALLTYTATPVSSTYGGAVPSFTGSVTGFVNNDTLSSATTGSASFTSSATSSSNVGSYAINGSGLTATNYTFVQDPGNATAFTINPALLTYTATPVSTTYGGAVPSLTGSVTGFVNNDTLSSATTGTASFTSSATSSSNVGSYAINGSGLTATNYTFAQDPSNATALTINPALLTYTAASAARTYGASNPTFSGSVSGFVNNDTLSSATTGSASFTSSATSSSNVGSYAINGSGLTATNYTFAQDPGNATALTINPALLTYTATPVSSTYGGAVPSFTGSVTGFVNNDTLSSATTGSASFTSSATSSSNVGSYAINGSGLTATNYTFAQDPSNATAFTINPALLTYTATPVSTTYGGAVPSLTGSVTGFVDNDTLSSATTGTASFTSSATSSSNVGSYAINGSGLTATNYTFAQDPSNATALTINPALLTYTAAFAARTYGASNPTFSGSVSGFVNNDTLSSATTGSASFTSSATSSSNVGSYAINGSGLTATNYTFAQDPGNATALTINPALLTYTATPVSSTYGGAVPSFTGSVTGFVNNDTLSSATTGSAIFTSSATSSSNVGSYAINGSGLTATNYTFAQDPGNATAFTINPALLTYTAASASRTYGASNPTFSGSVSGFVNNDTLSSATSGSAAFTSSATSSSNVGSYTINGSGLTATNYTFAQDPGNATALTINPALLTYTAASASRTYGASNPTFSGSVTGFVNNDTLSSATTGSASFTSSATSSSNVGSYAINGSGLTATNYTFAQDPSNATALTINPALLTYTAASAARTYGASNPSFSGSVSGFVNNDTLSSATTGTASFTSSATAASNVGSYAINGSGLTANFGNYTFVQDPGNATALTINPALLTYIASPVSRTYGAMNPPFAGAITGFVNGDTLGNATSGSTAFTSSATAASNVGSYAVNGGGLTANNGNYTFAQAEGNASALTISPATLTYTATPARQLYGNGNTVFSGTVSGFVDGQTLATATTGTARFTSATSALSPAGSYAIDGAGLTANHGNYTFTQAAGNATALTITPTPMPTPTPAPTPTPTGSPTVLTFAIGNTTDIQGSRPTFTAAYTGPAIQGVDIAAILAGFTFSVTPSPISGPGVYTVTATGAAPHGYTLAIAPATLTVVAGTPQVLPSQVPALPTLVPLLLPSSNGVSATNLLPPLNSAGLFQIEISNTELGAPQAPLAQSSFWIANTEPATYAAGAKPR